MKPKITPLEILDVNEGRTDGNIEILKRFSKDIGHIDEMPMVGYSRLLSSKGRD